MSVPKEDTQKTFYPHFVAEIAAAILVCLQILLIIAMIFVPEMGRQIDLSRQFQPRPEWYFLWLFELVRYFPGRSIIIGTVLIPLVTVLLLMLIPFIDSGRNGEKRTSAVFYMLALMPALLTILYLSSR